VRGELATVSPCPHEARLNLAPSQDLRKGMVVHGDLRRTGFAGSEMCCVCVWNASRPGQACAVCVRALRHSCVELCD
jgi:hypothetical protein